MKRELNIFLHALQYYTRFPVPFKVNFSEGNLSKSLRYFPLIGALVGGTGSLALYLSGLLLPHVIGLLFAISAILLTTGAMHEDGLSDFLDGFGGGNSKEDILRIMKESSIGVFGTIGLIITILTKISCLYLIPEDYLISVLISANVSSRLWPIILVNTSTYAREGLSKASYTRKKPDRTTILIATITALAPLLYFKWHFSLLYLILSILFFSAYRGYLTRRLSGFTGDTLGALQLINELLFYITFLATLQSCGVLYI